MLSSNQSGIATTMARLSSGKRINSARDDAAGLAISERLNTKVRGLAVTSRNALDAQSMLQTSDGALGAITENLQRMRELAVQAANGTLSASDRDTIQLEVSQLKNEIDRIAKETSFNGVNLLDRDAVYTAADFEAGTSFDRIDFSALEGDELVEAQKQVIVDQLRNRWLAEAEDLVETYYGMKGDGVSIEIFIDEEPVTGTEGFAAYVSSSVNPVTGLGEQIELHLNLDSFLPLNPPTTGVDPSTSINQFNALGLADRTIAHEMAHAVARRNINTGTSRWFEEGMADFLTGADERVSSYLFAAGQSGDSSIDVALPNIAGNNVTNRNALADEIGDGTGGGDAWNTAGEYASSYVAVRYLDQAIRDSGGAGIRDVLDIMKSDPSSETVDSAIAQVVSDLGVSDLRVSGYSVGFTDEASFISAFRTNGDAGGGGSQFIRDELDIMNYDTGSIAGSDVSAAGWTLDAKSVVSDESNYQVQPLEHWDVVFPEGFEPPEPTPRMGTELTTVSVQLGTQRGETIDMELGGANLDALRLTDLDVSSGDGSALAKIDRALDHVSYERALLGASMNRLEMAHESASLFALNLSDARSRIADADFAVEMSDLTRRQVLQQAGISMLAQANAQSGLILQLLT